MSIGCFTDKTQPPTAEEVREALAGALPLWSDLLRLISELYGVEGEMRFYGRSYGWALRFRKSGKALLSLYPGSGTFTAQVVLSRAQAETAMGLALGQKTREVLESAHEYPEGRWLFVPVESDEDARDIQQLLALKARPAQARLSRATGSRRSVDFVVEPADDGVVAGDGRLATPDRFSSLPRVSINR